MESNLWTPYNEVFIGFHFGGGRGTPDSFIVELDPGNRLAQPRGTGHSSRPLAPLHRSTACRTSISSAGEHLLQIAMGVVMFLNPPRWHLSAWACLARLRPIGVAPERDIPVVLTGAKQGIHIGSLFSCIRQKRRLVQGVNARTRLQPNPDPEELLSVA